MSSVHTIQTVFSTRQDTMICSYFKLKYRTLEMRVKTPLEEVQWPNNRITKEIFRPKEESKIYLQALSSHCLHLLSFQ